MIPYTIMLNYRARSYVLSFEIPISKRRTIFIAKHFWITAVKPDKIPHAAKIRLLRPSAQVLEHHVPVHLVAQFSHRSSPFGEGESDGKPISPYSLPRSTLVQRWKSRNQWECVPHWVPWISWFGNSYCISYNVALSASSRPSRANVEQDRHFAHAAKKPGHLTFKCRLAVKVPSVIGLRLESNWLNSIPENVPSTVLPIFP